MENSRISEKIYRCDVIRIAYETAAYRNVKLIDCKCVKGKLCKGGKCYRLENAEPTLQRWNNVTADLAKKCSV